MSATRAIYSLMSKTSMYATSGAELLSMHGSNTHGYIATAVTNTIGKRQFSVNACTLSSASISVHTKQPAVKHNILSSIFGYQTIVSTIQMFFV